MFSISAVALTAGRDYYFPWVTPVPIIIDQLASEVTTSGGGNMRIGIYAMDTDWQPVGAPLADSGDIAVTQAVKTYTPGTPLYLPRGRYAGVLNHSASSSFRSANGGSFAGTSVGTSIGTTLCINQASVARAYAAFPTPGTAWDTVNNSNAPMIHPVFYRISSP